MYNIQLQRLRELVYSTHVSLSLNGLKTVNSSCTCKVCMMHCTCTCTLSCKFGKYHYYIVLKNCCCRGSHEIFQRDTVLHTDCSSSSKGYTALVDPSLGNDVPIPTVHPFWSTALVTCQYLFNSCYPNTIDRSKMVQFLETCRGH